MATGKPYLPVAITTSTCTNYFLLYKNSKFAAG